MKIEINKGDFEVDSKVIKEVVKSVVQELQEIERLKKGQEIEMSIAVVDKEKIKEINRQWRKKDEETDVLSFCYENTAEKLEGEIILCLDVIKENAEKDGIEVKEELIKNVIHSVLHIAGYEHGDEMFNLQEKVRKNI